MGRRGPKPKTPWELRASGSWRAGLLDHAVKAEPGAPPCPRWLDPDAKKAWRWLAQQLAIMRVLSKADRAAMMRYCQTFSRWKRAEMFLQKYGHTYPLKDQAGKVRCFMAFPEVNIAATLAQQLGRLEQEFGLTPASRSRLWPESAPQVDDEISQLRQKFFGTSQPSMPSLPAAVAGRSRARRASNGDHGTGGTGGEDRLMGRSCTRSAVGLPEGQTRGCARLVRPGPVGGGHDRRNGNTDATETWACSL